MHFRNIQTSFSQDATALIFWRVEESWSLLLLCCVRNSGKEAQTLYLWITAKANYLFSCACEGSQALPLLRSLVNLSLFYSPVSSIEDHGAFFFSPGNLTFQFLPICLRGASIKSNWLSQASFHAFAHLLLSDLLKNVQLCLTSALNRKTLKDNNCCLCLA